MKRGRYTTPLALGTSVPPSQPKLKSSRVLCKNCQRDVTLDVHIQCASCEEFELCLTCFSVGAELHPHKSHHDYRVIKGAHFPLYTLDWGADEELLLLEGVSLFGMGNWPDISEHVQTKAADECKAHFFAVYVDTPTFPEPAPPLLQAVVDANSPMPVHAKILDKDKKNSVKAMLSQPAKAHLGSFMPLRGEFDSPWREDAEDIPAHTVFLDDDTPEERAMKVQALQVFCALLEERKRRTQFLLRCDLLDWKTHMAFERGLTREDAQLLATLRPFLQCQTKEQWEKLVNGLLAEQHLRREIRSYQSMREAGLHWLYEADMHKAGTKKSKSVSALPRGGYSNAERHNLRSSGSSASFTTTINSSASHTLSPVERDLCESINAAMESYLIMKETLVRESCRAGKVSRADARRLLPLPSFAADSVFDFFVASGWINCKDGDGALQTSSYAAPPPPPQLMYGMQMQQQLQQQQQYQHYQQQQQQQALPPTTQVSGSASRPTTPLNGPTVTNIGNVPVPKMVYSQTIGSPFSARVSK